MPGGVVLLLPRQLPFTDSIRHFRLTSLRWRWEHAWGMTLWLNCLRWGNKWRKWKVVVMLPKCSSRKWFHPRVKHKYLCCHFYRCISENLLNRLSKANKRLDFSSVEACKWHTLWQYAYLMIVFELLIYKIRWFVDLRINERKSILRNMKICRTTGTPCLTKHLALLRYPMAIIEEGTQVYMRLICQNKYMMSVCCTQNHSGAPKEP